MANWLKAALFGVLVVAWSAYDIFISTEPASGVMRIINYVALVAGVVILFGSLLTARKAAS